MTPLKRLFGKNLQLDKLPAEIKPLLDEMRQERAAFESLLLQAEGMMKRADQLGQSVAPVQQQLAQVLQRLATLDQLAEQFTDLRHSALGLEESQRASRARLDETRRLAEEARAELDGMRNLLGEALKAKEVLPGLLELVKPLADLRTQAAALDERVREVAGGLDRLRVEHEQITGASAGAVSRLADLENDLQGAAGRLEAFQTRAGQLERAMEELPQLLKEVPDVKRDMSTLNVLAEYVSQKVATLESQRDVVERTTQRAERLAELVSQVDRQLQEQHENTKFLSQLQSKVDELKKFHEAALQHAEAIEEKHRAIDTEDQRLTEDFRRPARGATEVGQPLPAGAGRSGRAEPALGRASLGAGRRGGAPPGGG
jgi:chromosome segregation ATPase